MIGSWEMAGLSEPDRYFCFAEAYLQASIGTCHRMKDHESQRTWPNASVALMLAAHSVELFLKGAILRKGKDVARGHKLEDLDEDYRAAYPEVRFAFERPFKTQYLGFTETEIEMVKKTGPIPSIQFRYPVSKPGVEWQGVHAFEPNKFLTILEDLINSYIRLRREFVDT
jgi:hypothetical protein